MVTEFERKRRKQTTRAPGRLFICAVAFLLAADCLSANPRGNNPSRNTVEEILEFRGYIRIGAVTEFSIFNKQTQQSEWLAIGTTVGEYRVERFDRATNSLHIRHNDATGILALKASQIARYIPSAPVSRPDEPGSRQTASSRPPTIHNPHIRTPEDASSGIPSFPETRLIDSTTDSPRSSQQFLGSRGGSQLPGTPPTPPGISPGLPPRNDGPNNPDTPNSPDPDDADPWRSIGSPPPPPPTPPPSYSPEE